MPDNSRGYYAECSKEIHERDLDSSANRLTVCWMIDIGYCRVLQKFVFEKLAQLTSTKTILFRLGSRDPSTLNNANVEYPIHNLLYEYQTQKTKHT